MRLRGRLAYHLSLHTRATVLRLWARAIENMPYIRLADLTQAGDLFSRIVAYLREFFDEATATDLLHHKTVGKDLADTPVATEALAYAALKALAEVRTVLDVLERAAVYQRGFTDSRTPADRAFVQAEKSIDDLIDQYNETVSRAVGKGLSDSASGAESLGKDALKARTDTPLTTDSARRTLGKATTEFAQATETLARHATRQATAERVTSFSELVARSLTRPCSDSAATGDSLTRAWGYGRAFSEGGLYAEPGYFADDYVAKDLEPVDTAYRGTSKPQADSTTASDSVSRVHSGLRSFTETVPATEWRTRTSGKPLAETLALTEALALSLFKPLSEDARYAEDGYFADDYVTAGLVPADALSVTLNP